jgi:hypothetical protein
MYHKNDKHNTKQIKYRQQLTLSPIAVADSGYFPLDHSPTNTADVDTPSLSLHDVDGLRVRNSRHSSHPRRFVFRKFVRKPNCSWSEAFLNRGLTVYETSTDRSAHGGICLLH